MKRLNLTPTSLRFLDGLPGKQFKQIVNAIFNLLKNPEPQDSSELKGYPFRRIDVGEYRVVYDIQGDEVRIQLIGKRNDDEVYRKLGRQR